MTVMVLDIPVDFNKSQGEQEIFNPLKELESKCYIFHSVRWMGSHNLQLKLGKGEARFRNPIFIPSSLIFECPVIKYSFNSRAK